MPGTKTASGIKPNTKNRSFEVALALALNPGMVLRPSELAAELGLKDRQAQQICRQLIDGDIVERIRPGWYQSTLELQRMVALWTPKTEGPPT